MYGRSIKKCPICKAMAFKHVSYSEEMWGIVEQHGYCDRCGYVVEQAYSRPMDAFIDIKKGFNNGDKYIEKNVKKHKRIRRKRNIIGIEVNPMWVNFV